MQTEPSALQIFAVLSPDPVARRPSAAKATLLTPLRCPSSVARQTEPSALQILAVLSHEPVAMRPSAAKATLLTQPRCPSSVARQTEPSALQIFAVLSHEPVAIRPSGIAHMAEFDPRLRGSLVPTRDRERDRDRPSPVREQRPRQRSACFLARSGSDPWQADLANADLCDLAVPALANLEHTSQDNRPATSTIL